MTRLRLLAKFVIREWHEAYAGTSLGVLWNLMQPLALVTIYWWLFAVVWSVKLPALHASEAELPFSVFLLTGMLPWLAVQESINKSASAVLGRADVLRHGRFPVWVFPLAKVTLAHLVYLAVYVFFIIAARGEVVLQQPLILLLLLLLYGLQWLAAAGMGLLLSSVSVFLRDVPHALGLLSMLVMFTAPVLYPPAQIPAGMQAWIWLNPFTSFALGYQTLLLQQAVPGLAVWAAAAFTAALALLLGGLVFRRLRPGFADMV